MEGMLALASCHKVGSDNILKANAIGRSSKTVREFLEKNHRDDMDREETIKLTIKSLLEVVQTGAKNIEISIMEGYNKVSVSYLPSMSFYLRFKEFIGVQSLDLTQIEAIVAEIEREKEAGRQISFTCSFIYSKTINLIEQRPKGNDRDSPRRQNGRRQWQQGVRRHRSVSILKSVYLVVSNITPEDHCPNTTRH